MQRAERPIASRFAGILVAICLSIGVPGLAAEPAQQPRILHLLNRIAFGPSPEDLAHVAAIGVERYIDEQLDPAAIEEPLDLKMRLANLATLRLDPVRLRQMFGPPRAVPGIKPSPEEVKMREARARLVFDEAAEARLLRALYSRRQLQEVMVDFWFNHFNVYSEEGLKRIWVGNYEEQAIRPYALGHFRDLLLATAKHPAMLLYLDNFASRKGAINENYAREVIELHTMGADAGYTQEDVIALARVLTGWGVNAPDAREYPDYAAVFKGAQHDYGPKVFLGQPLLTSGRAEGEEALTILARSPSTAHHIAFELAQYFVADAPPPALVDRLAARFIASDGDIAAVLKTLLMSPEFWDSAGQKYKTPYQFVTSAVRAAGIAVRDTRPLQAMLRTLGMPLYGCATPDGYRNTEAAWLSPEASLQRIAIARRIAAGDLPLGGVLLPADGRHPADAARLEQLLGATLSPRTRDILAETASARRAALILGSPDFMRR